MSLNWLTSVFNGDVIVDVSDCKFIWVVTIDSWPVLEAVLRPRFLLARREYVFSPIDDADIFVINVVINGMPVLAAGLAFIIEPSKKWKKSVKLAKDCMEN